MQPDSKLNSFIKFLTEEFFQKKVLILGFGKEGRSTFKLLSQYLPEVEFVIADGNKTLLNLPLLKGVDKKKLHFNANYLEAIKDADVVIKSPGVKLPFDKTIGKQLTSQTDLFLRFYKEQVVGVTGTKGKSTTSTLIHHILAKTGKNSILLGNIGLPAFDMISEISEKTIVVFELSAHQLEFVKTSPHIAVLLSVFPEHLDYFKDFASYKNAKENIFRYQTENDVLITLKSLRGDSENIKSKSRFLDLAQTAFDKKIKIPLLGKHNLQNISAALLATGQFGISKAVALNSLLDFKSLPHRLEYVGRFKSIDFYNDSISTIPESAIAAVEALHKVDTLILGGFDRGLDYSKLAVYLSGSEISNFIFLGKAGETIQTQLEKVKKKDVKLIRVSILADAFPIILELTKPGCICLLSPAASSYDQFHNFEHRGDTFKYLTRNLADKKQ